MKKYLMTSFLVTMSSALIIGFMYRHYLSLLDQNFLEKLNIGAEEVIHDLTNHSVIRTKTLERMADRTANSNLTDNTIWRIDAKNHIEHDSGYHSILLVDQTNHINSVEPSLGNKSALGKNICSEYGICDTSKQVFRTHSIAYSNHLGAADQEMGLFVVSPIFSDSVQRGFIIGVFRIEHLIQEAIKTGYFKNDLIAQFYLGTSPQIIYESKTYNSVDSNQFKIHKEMRLGNNLWTARFKPSMKLLEQHTTYDHAFWLSVGIGISVLLGFTTYVSLASRAQKNILKSTSKHLNNAKENLEKFVERYNLLIASTDVGLWDWYDIAEDKSYCSPKFFELLGYEENEWNATFENFKTLIHSDDHDKTTEALEAHFDHNVPFDLEFQLKLKTGEYRWFRSMGQAYRDDQGTPKRMVGAITDIHDKKLNEVEMQRALATKSNFLSLMSHEIRTPLTAVLGMGEVLADSLKGSGLKQEIECTRRLNLAGSHLKNLIDDLLFFSKLETNKVVLNKSEFSLYNVIKNVVEMMEVQAEAKNLRLNTNLPELPEVLTIGDPDRISQILLNLIGNAIKFTEVGEITIMTYIDSIPEQIAMIKVRFEISDTGIGIKPDDFEGIFEAFQQLTKPKLIRRDGTGLGLAISKKLTDIMKGELWLKSKENEGSTFYVELPLPLSSHSKEIHSQHENDVDFSCKITRDILVVDDQEENKFLINQFVKDQPFRVTMASNGKEALEKAMEKDFDCILMDARMPIMDGYEATQEIRSHEKLNSKSRTPIIFFSAHAFKEEIDRALKCGCDDYLTKPIVKSELLKVLETNTCNLLRNSRLPKAPKIRKSESSFQDLV